MKIINHFAWFMRIRANTRKALKKQVRVLEMNDVHLKLEDLGGQDLNLSIYV